MSTIRFSHSTMLNKLFQPMQIIMYLQ